MSQYINVNSYATDQSELKTVINALRDGKVIAYPTDSGYALGCKMGLKKPMQMIKKIRNLTDKHNFTLICKDLSEISNYAKVDNVSYRILKRCTPGGYTFILPATNNVPSLMLNKSKKTVGIRVSDHRVPLILSENLGEPLLSTTLMLPKHDTPIVYAEDLDSSCNVIDYVLESDYCGYEQTTVVDMTNGDVKVLRVGSGDVSLIE